MMVFTVCCGQRDKGSKNETPVIEDVVNPPETGLPSDAQAFDRGVVINGVKWASRNVASPGTFAAGPEDAGMFYQWNNKKAWETSGDEVSGWDSSISADEAWAASHDPSPAGWRVPTHAEFVSLFDEDKVSSVWTNQGGVEGRQFTDKASGNSIFLPAAGYRSSDDGALGLVGMQGNYWRGTTYGSDGAYGVFFYSEGLSMNDGEDRDFAFSIRPVAAGL